MSRDEIMLTLPRRRPFFAVAHLVLGGLAARHQLTVEALDDLQLALEELLDRPDGEQPVTVALRIEDGTIHAAVGPFERTELLAALEREPEDAVGLRRLLDTVVDGYELAERAGGQWVEVTKSARPTAA